MKRYNPESVAVVMIECEKGFEVSIVTAMAWEPTGELFYDLSDG